MKPKYLTIIIVLGLFVIILLILDAVLNKPRVAPSPKENKTENILLTPTLIPEATRVASDSSAFPEGAAEKEEDFQLKNHPDFYLFRKTPFDDPAFSVTSNLKPLPHEHFGFSVTIKSADKAKGRTTFLNWVKSQGLTLEQISSLDIEYL